MRRRRGGCRGLSLLECLVALALGLVVVGAVSSHYISAGQSARLQAAQAQMAEDAQIGLQLLASDLMMAGYAQPQSLQAGADGPRWQTALTEAPLLACDTGFVSASTTGTPVCASSGSSAALELRYQADEYNTIPLSGTSRPSDCLGSGLKAENGVYLTANRWYVAVSQGRTELRCASRLGNPGQPLVENVEALALWFAEAAQGTPASPVRYVKAGQVADFALVASVRLCLLMRSADPVLDAAATYLDCEGRSQVGTDRRLRQAFHTTVALRSRRGG